jgi:ankyrin repeat protein
MWEKFRQQGTGRAAKRREGSMTDRPHPASRHGTLSGPRRGQSAKLNATAVEECIPPRRKGHLGARECSVYGATRLLAGANFCDEIKHYMFEGDTALHMAMAACQEHIAIELIAKGADVCARHRRGAEPLHYAADGAPTFSSSEPEGSSRNHCLPDTSGCQSERDR